MKPYFDRIDESLFISLFFINIFIFLILLTAMVGIRITAFTVLLELAVMLFVFIYHVETSQKHVERESYGILAVILIALVFYVFLIRFFSVIKWDGALFLLNGKMFVTQAPILYAYYKPLTWSAFLSIGLAFNFKEIIPLLAITMFVASVYLFTLTLTKNKVIALYSCVLSIFVPALLLWGLSYYSETYLAALTALGFASYFHFNNTNRKEFYILAVFLFTMAFLTRYTFGLILVIPAIEFFRRKLWIGVIPFIVTLLPYLAYQQHKANNFLYPFVLYYTAASKDVTNNVFSNMYYIEQMNSLFSWVLLILALIGLVVLVVKEKNINIFSFLLFLGLKLIYFLFFLHLKDVRYLIFAIPLVTASTAYLIYNAVNFTWKHAKWLMPLATSVLIVNLLFNFNTVIIPQYKYTGMNVMQQAAEYMQGTEGNIASNSHVILSWYMQRRVYNAVKIDELNEYTKKNNIRYIINFEHSGTPVEFRNTKKLLGYGKLVKSFTDGFEKINVIKVNMTMTKGEYEVT